MERSAFGRMNQLSVLLAAVALGSCARGESREAELPDSAMLEVAPDPAGAPQPARVDTLTPAPPPTWTTPATTPRVAPVQPTPTRTDPPVRRPPPPRDTRPSIPWPPDTL